MPIQSRTRTQSHLRPLLKWPGGKRALAESIVALLPRAANRYYEPFLGGAAIFFAIRPTKATLSDTNNELINLYENVRDSPVELIALLKTYKNTEADYYQIRHQTPRTPLRRAARLLYLTTLAFNGLHRVNLEGRFNVPYGHKTHLLPYDETRILAASRALARADLRVADFEITTSRARAGDVVYFDPPYTVAHGNNGFLKYNERIFSWADQVRLAAHAHTLAHRGCCVIVSNADHRSINALYRDFKCIKVNRFSRIAASSEFRKPITEKIYYMPGQSDA